MPSSIEKQVNKYLPIVFDSRDDTDDNNEDTSDNQESHNENDDMKNLILMKLLNNYQILV